MIETAILVSAITWITIDTLWKTHITRKLREWEADWEQETQTTNVDTGPLDRKWANLWNASWWCIDGRWVSKQGYFWTLRAWDRHPSLRRQGRLTEKQQDQPEPTEEVLQRWRSKGLEALSEIAAKSQDDEDGMPRDTSTERT